MGQHGQQDRYTPRWQWKRLLTACLLGAALGCSSAAAGVRDSSASGASAEGGGASAETVERARPPAPRAIISPSTGCGRERGPTGELSLAFGSRTGQYVLTLPPGYTPEAPAPLVFAFHGFTRTHVQMYSGDASRLAEEVGSRAIVAYVKSQGESWDRPGELEPSLELYDALYEHLLATHCVDVERVFALGISSGGFFTTEVVCRHPERLAAAAVVSGAIETHCDARMPILFVHGPADTEVPVSRGWHVRDYFLSENGCGPRTAPTSIEQCVFYADCYPGYPLWWCQHDEPTYDNTNHGWPSFASQAIATFFDTIKVPANEPPNLIENGRFDSTSAPWQGNLTPPASGSVDVRSGVHGGALCLTIDQPGQFAWDAALSYAGFQLERGQRYTIDFRAWASAPTRVRATLGMANSPYREHWVRYFELGTQPRHWRNSIVMSDPYEDNHQLAFQGGGPAARTLPVTFCIDDVQVSAW
jgi:polyhydroxybutyrate depolymerase